MTKRKTYQLARNIYRYWLDRGYAIAVWVEQEDGRWVVRSTLRGGLPLERDRIGNDRITA